MAKRAKPRCPVSRTYGSRGADFIDRKFRVASSPPWFLRMKRIAEARYGRVGVPIRVAYGVMPGYDAKSSVIRDARGRVLHVLIRVDPRFKHKPVKKRMLVAHELVEAIRDVQGRGGHLEGDRFMASPSVLKQIKRDTGVNVRRIGWRLKARKGGKPYRE